MKGGYAPFGGPPGSRRPAARPRVVTVEQGIDHRQDDPEREVVDGVVYVRRPCVECGAPLSVAESSVLVSTGMVWPRCTDCIREALP